MKLVIPENSFTRRLLSVGHIAVAIIILGVSVSANAMLIRVSQESFAGAGDFDTNVIGSVEAYSTAMTIADFYGYGRARYNGHLNGGPTAAIDTTLNFFAIGSNGLGFYNIHDAPDNTDGHAAKMIWNAGGRPEYHLLDEASASQRLYAYNPSTDRIEQTGDPLASNGDAYSLEQLDDHSVFTAVSRGWQCCTDGFVLGQLEDDWSLTGGFYENPLGLNSWQVMSADGDVVSLNLQAGQRVRYDLVALPVPTPPVLGWIALALVIAALRKGREEKSSSLTR